LVVNGFPLLYFSYSTVRFFLFCGLGTVLFICFDKMHAFIVLTLGLVFISSLNNTLKIKHACFHVKVYVQFVCSLKKGRISFMCLTHIYIKGHSFIRRLRCTKSEVGRGIATKQKRMSRVDLNNVVELL